MPATAEAALNDGDEEKSREENHYDHWCDLDEFATRTIDPVGGPTLYRVNPLTVDRPEWERSACEPDPLPMAPI